MTSPKYVVYTTALSPLKILMYICVYACIYVCMYLYYTNIYE